MSFPIEIKCFSWNLGGLENFELYIQDMINQHISKETNIIVIHLQESPSIKNLISIDGFDLKEHLFMNDNLAGMIIRSYMFVKKTISKLVTVNKPILKEGFASKKAFINIVSTKGILDLNISIDNKQFSFVNIHNFAPTKVKSVNIAKETLVKQYQQIELSVKNIGKLFNQIFYLLNSDIELGSNDIKNINNNFMNILIETTNVLDKINDNVLRTKLELFLKDVNITMSNFKSLDIDIDLLNDMKRRMDKYPGKLSEYLTRSIQDIENKKLHLKDLNNSEIIIDSIGEFDNQIIMKVANFASNNPVNTYLFGDLNSRNIASSGQKYYSKFQLPGSTYEPKIENDFLLQNPTLYTPLKLDSNLKVPTYKIINIKDNNVVYQNSVAKTEEKKFPTSFPDRLLYSQSDPNITLIPTETLDKWFIKASIDKTSSDGKIRSDSSLSIDLDEETSVIPLSDHIPIMFGLKFDITVVVKKVFVFRKPAKSDMTNFSSSL